MEKYQEIKIKLKKYIIIAYCISAVLLLFEYLYYKITVHLGVMHYYNFLSSWLYGKNVTHYSGIHIIALFIILLMPIVIFILKKKTVFQIIIFIALFICNVYIVMISIALIGSHDVYSTGGLVFLDFNKYEKTDGETIICTQVMEKTYGQIVTIYLETGYNTLKEIKTIDITYINRQEIYWDTDKILLIFYIQNKKNDGESKKSIEITYNEMDNLIKKTKKTMFK